MAKQIRSMTELNSVMEKYCYEIIDKAGQKVKEKIEEFIREYYREYTPNQYQRVWKFLNSVVKTEPKKTSNGYKVEVYIDTSLVYQNGWTMEGTAVQANRGWHGWYHAVQVSDQHFWDDALREVPEIVADVVKSFIGFMSNKGMNISAK